MNLSEEIRFPIWSWVGARFPVWGAISLLLVIALGADVFSAFLKGASDMDCHMVESS